MGKPEKFVTITIDGQEVTVPEGTPVIEAAKRIGIEIPHYCYHPALSIAGSCRLCLVEIEGASKLTLACNTPVSDGMIIHTDTPAVREARRGTLEFLLLNHPLDCPVCDRGGECMLQRYSMDYGSAYSRTTEPRRRFRKPQIDPLIELERNRCILCTRCVRFLDEIAGEHCLDVFERGDRSYIGTFDDRPIKSIFSGMIIDYCPVGALTSKPFRFKARVWELEQVQSTCPYCSAGCPVTLWMRAGRIYRVTAPTVAGKLNFQLDHDGRTIICNQGRFGCDFANRGDRIGSPVIKRGETLARADWDEAIEETARRLGEIRNTFGPDSIGFIASSRATCEEMYLLQRLARDAVGTNNVDWRTAATDATAAKALSAALGRSTGQLDELDRYELVIVINSDLLGRSPVAALKIKEAARNGRAKLYLLGWRTDRWLARFARGAIRFGPEKTERILEGLSRKTAVGLRPLIAEGTKALDDLIADLQKAESGLIVFDPGQCNGLYAAGWTRAVIELAESLGKGWEVLAALGERNAVGAFMAGCQPDRLPGGWIADPARRSRIEERWGATLPEKPGLTAPEMIEAARTGRLKALFVLGASDFHAHPWLDSILDAVGNLDFLAVQDVFASPLSELANVVLPATLFFEKEGTLADVSGALARFAKGWPRASGIQDDLVVLDLVAQKLGKRFGYAEPGDVFAEMMQLIDPECPLAPGKLCSEASGGKSLFPCLNMPRAKARLQEGKFYTVCPTYAPTCRFVASRDPKPFEAETRGEGAKRPERALYLVWSKILRGADFFGDRSEVMAPLLDEPWIEIHPKDAERLGISEGDMVAIRGEEGASASGRARITPDIAEGLVYAPENLAGVRFEKIPERPPVVELEKVELSGEESA